MTSSVDKIPTPPPFIPAAPDVPAAPPIPEAPAVATFDKETKKLADPKKYFAALQGDALDACLDSQLIAWQTVLRSTDQTVRQVAERQIRSLAYILAAHAFLSDGAKFIKALEHYTNEELALLLCLYQKTCPDLSQSPIFAAAEAERGAIASPLERLYLSTNLPGWEAAFIQRPEELGRALIGEKERRTRENVVITADSRSQVEKPRVQFSEEATEQKTAEVKPALNIEELRRRQEARAQLAPRVPGKTLRKAYKKTLRAAGIGVSPFGVVLKKSSSERAPRPAATPAPIVFPVALRPTKPAVTISVTPPQ